MSRCHLEVGVVGTLTLVLEVDVSGRKLALPALALFVSWKQMLEGGHGGLIWCLPVFGASKLAVDRELLQQ
jgi:hypothetical protein